MNVYLAALGCRLNQAELEDMSRQLVSFGHAVVQDVTLAERVIVNTCTVTHVADRKSRQLIRRLHRLNPLARIAVTGCYAQQSAHVLCDLEGVDLVVGNGDKDGIVERVLAHDGRSVPARPLVATAPLAGGHTRAFVKIQDGCDNACSYCVVTIARGAQRSLAPEQVVETVKQRVAEGYREVVLTGVHIGAYGRDSHPSGALPPSKGWSLQRLVRRILDETGVARLRLSSLEPWDVTDELLALWQDARMGGHLHLPLQSGADVMLQSMNRDYTTAYFGDLVTTLRAAIPDLSLSTDVIVGFPGETEALFEQSARFIHEMAFSKLHVFRYSTRPGTVAAALGDPVPPAVGEQRARSLSEMSGELGRRFHEGFVGREVEVLFERQLKDGIWDGLSGNYCRVRAPSEQGLSNCIRRVLVQGADSTGLWGQLAAEEQRCD